MLAQFVSFAAVITHAHLYLTIQAFMSNLSYRKVLEQFSFTGHLECQTLCLLSLSLQILRVICDLCPFLMLDVFYVINEKYYGNFNVTLSTQLTKVFGSLQPKHNTALHVKCPCLWMNHRLDSFIEKMCSLPDMNSHEIPGVGAEIQPKDYITLYVKCPYLYTDRKQI